MNLRRIIVLQRKEKSWAEKLGDYVGMFDVREVVTVVIVTKEHVLEGVQRNEYADHKTSLEEVCYLLCKSRGGYLITNSNKDICFTNTKMVDRLHLIEFVHQCTYITPIRANLFM